MTLEASFRYRDAFRRRLRVLPGLGAVDFEPTSPTPNLSLGSNLSPNSSLVDGSTSLRPLGLRLFGAMGFKRPTSVLDGDLKRVCCKAKLFVVVCACRGSGGCGHFSDGRNMPGHKPQQE